MLTTKQARAIKQAFRFTSLLNARTCAARQDYYTGVVFGDNGDFLVANSNPDFSRLLAAGFEEVSNETLSFA